MAAVAAALDAKKGAANTGKGRMKRPAAAIEDDEGDDGADAKGKPVGTKRPTVTFVSTRNCVTARTGVDGIGQTKSVSIKNAGSKAKATKAAHDWLREKCGEMGVRYDLDE